MSKVDCAYDAMVDTVNLVPNPRNPNKHPKAQIDLLAKILTNCWRNPIVVSNRSGFIVKGHARLEAAKQAGINPVPVDYQDYQSEAEEWADMIADNRLAELAEPSLPELKDLLEELDKGDFDMDLTGFDASSLEDLMTWTSEPVKLDKVKTDPRPPALSWILVGIPTVRFGEISEYIEKLAKIDGVVCETTVLDE